VRVSIHRKVAAKTLVAVVYFLLSFATHPASGKPAGDATLSPAICPIVYPVDEFPSQRGYRYLFYGDGFFINEQGYFITAAHVLSSLHGGQPFILLRQTAGPPQFVSATLVVMDREHDVAVLRATPNPFDGKYKVGFLPLAFDRLMQGHAVIAASLLPPWPREAYTLDALVDDRSPGDVFDFQFSQLDKGRGDTELFLFNHVVRRGQSGAPIVSAESQGVVGFVEGQWLRSTVVPLETAADEGKPGVGAAVLVHYAIALLQQMGVPWHTASRPLNLNPPENPAVQASEFSAPAPLSLVGSSYPSQALFGGEVVLDALIDSRGRVAETKVICGPSPFLEKVLSTVRTWSFFPARLGGLAVAARVGITFQFSQSYEPSRATPAQSYDGSLAGSIDRGPMPVLTVEPQYAATSVGDGSVILYDRVDQKGQIVSVQVVSDSESLGPAALTAENQWRFVPGRRAGMDVDSAAIVVMAFRRIESTPLIPPKRKK
jgi:trypsin-like peptidase/TonB-like protein